MNTTLLVLAMSLVAGIALAQSGPAEQAFQAAAITRLGHLQFEAPIATVFPLFTPQGERHWAQGWDPEILYPRDQEVAEGMVFRTREGVEHVWTITRYDPAAHAIAYNVVAPGILVRRIEVRCRPAGSARTEADVSDSYIGLSAQGNEVIGRLSEANYAKKMAHWKEAIGGYLAKAGVTTK